MVKRKRANIGDKTSPCSNAETVNETRRRKNREAQNVFRKRRQAAEAMQSQRMQHLEQVVEDMSLILVNLAQEILAADELKHSPTLATSLQRSMKHALTLTREVASLDNDLPDSSDTAEVEDGVQSSTDVVAEQSSNPSVSESKWEWPGSSTAPSSVSPNTNTVTPWRLVTPVDTYMPNINFGYTMLGASFPISGEGRPPFSFRLLEASLTRAYSLITKAPLADIQREFGHTLKRRKREDIAASIEWALGPGRFHMYQITALSDDTGSTTVSSSSQSAAAFGPNTGPKDVDMRNAGMFSATDVYVYLKSLGAKMIDNDTMEIAADATPTPTSSTARVSSTSLTIPRNIEQKFVSLVWRLPVPLLIDRLVQIGICYDDSPGYSRRSVTEVIAASATATYKET